MVDGHCGGRQSAASIILIVIIVEISINGYCPDKKTRFAHVPVKRGIETIDVSDSENETSGPIKKKGSKGQGGCTVASENTAITPVGIHCQNNKSILTDPREHRM